MRYACTLRYRRGAALVPPALKPSFFVSPTEIGIRDYIINIHVTRRVSRRRAPYTSANVYSLVRPRVRTVYSCVVDAYRRRAQPVYRICLYTHTDNTRGGNRLREASGAQPFPYRFVFLRSFSLSCLHALLSRGSAARTGH